MYENTRVVTHGAGGLTWSRGKPRLDSADSEELLQGDGH